MTTQTLAVTTTMMMKFPVLAAAAFAFLAVGTTVEAFSVLPAQSCSSRRSTLFFARPAAAETEYSFIDTELRGAAMRLHTREQAPREGQAAPAVVPPPYTPTRDDYLAFLVDSHYVYSVMEDIVNKHVELVMFRNTGLERTGALERDIQYLCETYSLRRPDVGLAGRRYAELLLRTMPSSGATTPPEGKENNVPAFICHYYNHYFAHTAGGRMIGKKMSNLLLDGTVLQFYQVRASRFTWERGERRHGLARSVCPHDGSTSCYYCFVQWENGNLNQMKATVKEAIEDLARNWSKEERQECVDATAAAFAMGGALNSYLFMPR
jgi:heme oxygenase (biliverdin-producing, ferredoxin)